MLAIVPVLPAQTPEIMSWGENLPDWPSKLKLTALREGCTATPAYCAPYLTNLALKEGVSRVYVSMPLDVSTATSYAAQYSSLSLAYPKVVEVGFDDFVGGIENLQIAGKISDPGSFVSAVITDIKSKNPNLQFGITTYADSLTHGLITSSTWLYHGLTFQSIPASVLARVDNVHLFVHYREDASTYATAVATAKKIFPNAKIFAGAYPYDRIDYLPCAKGGTTPCTLSQEESLYQQLLNTQIAMAKNGTVRGIEFFFGYFGDPQDFPGWTTNSRYCNSTRLSACYANTSTMQNMTLNSLTSGFSVTSGTPALTLQYSSVYMGDGPVGHQGTPANVLLKSTGTAAVVISDIVTAGTNGADFHVSHNCITTVAPGQACTLSIYFTPLAKGTRSGEVIIYDNTAAGKHYITLTGLGT
jgi:hypothetical protein